MAEKESLEHTLHDMEERMRDMLDDTLAAERYKVEIDIVDLHQSSQMTKQKTKSKYRGEQSSPQCRVQHYGFINQWGESRQSSWAALM